MGLLDKVKEQAGQIAEKAQQGVTQGKDKLEELQAHKKADGLLRDLGAAYYAQLRKEAPRGAVEDALTALDAHVAEHGELSADATIDITGTPAT